MANNLTHEQLLAATPHVEYEMGMLRYCTQQTLLPPSAEHNLGLEGALLHARTMTDFLWAIGSNADDLHAWHFVRPDRQSAWRDRYRWGRDNHPILRAWRKHTNKMLAHLSAYRFGDLGDDKPDPPHNLDEWLNPIEDAWLELVTESDYLADSPYEGATMSIQW